MEGNINELLNDIDFETAQALLEQEKTLKPTQSKTEGNEKSEKIKERDYDKDRRREYDRGEKDRQYEKEHHKDRDHQRDRERDRERNRYRESDRGYHTEPRNKDRTNDYRDKNRDRDMEYERKEISRDKNLYKVKSDPHRERDREKDRDAYTSFHKDIRSYGDRQQRTRSRSRDQNRSRNENRVKHKSKSPPKMNKKEMVVVEKTIEEARRQALEAQRDDCTVLMYRLSLDAKEKDIFYFLAKAGIGRVVDIKLIRDPRNGKSKGCSYVEFASQESVHLATSLTGQLLCGTPVIIQSSQAEKNRLAAAAKYKKDQFKEQQQKIVPRPAVTGTSSELPMKVYVGGLTEHLADVTENDLYTIFYSFGDIDYIDLHRDPISGKCKGYAFMQFRSRTQAASAISAMNGFNYRGKLLKVGEAHEGQRTNALMPGEMYYPPTELDESTLQNFQSKMTLMQKLNRDTNNYAGLGLFQSNYILMSNLFDPKEVDLQKEPDFYEETYADVMDQCIGFGQVEKVWVDRNSLGNVWVKFSNHNTEAAATAVEKLNGRFFAGRSIIVSFVDETAFLANVPK